MGELICYAEVYERILNNSFIEQHLKYFYLDKLEEWHREEIRKDSLKNYSFNSMRFY